METLLIIIAILFIVSLVVFFFIKKKKSNVTPPVVIPPIVTPTEPQIGNHVYEVTGRWSKEDTLHNCPEKCGFVIYKDYNGVSQTLNGLNVDDHGFENPILIYAYEIIARAGVNLKLIS